MILNPPLPPPPPPPAHSFRIEVYNALFIHGFIITFSFRGHWAVARQDVSVAAELYSKQLFPNYDLITDKNRFKMSNHGLINHKNNMT